MASEEIMQKKRYYNRHSIKQLKKLKAHFKEFESFTLQRFASTETILEAMIEEGLTRERRK